MRTYEECLKTSPEEREEIMHQMTAQNALDYIKTNNLDTSKEFIIKNINFLMDATFTPPGNFNRLTYITINDRDKNVSYSWIVDTKTNKVGIKVL